jgi:predicted DNA-binding transcriptional regulator AlpA
VASVESYCDERVVATALGVSRKTLQSWRLQRKGPPFLKLGARVAYPVSQVNEWCRRRTQGALVPASSE